MSFFFKTPRINWPRWLKAAEGQSCVKCGINDGTICFRHYEGIRQHAYNKARGQKCDDIFGADLCMKCDAELSTKNYKDLEQSEEFSHCVLLTIKRRYEQGFFRKAP